MAWFIATDGKLNPFDTGAYRYAVQAVDVFNKPATPPTGGETVQKRVGAQNTGDFPAFVRIMVHPSILAEDGVTILPAKIGKEVLIGDLNTTDWAYGGDGYYYYLHALEPDKSTTQLGQDLFTNVILAGDLGFEYDKASLQIEVQMESSDIRRWNYRQGWWKTTAPQSAGALSSIDSTLAAQTVA
ncbi:MAG: hypothetical protein LBC83_04645 [Oscillospiraceae bacterium]|nr:hypothetical protein [Oscillospiraceae bacterium]